MIFVSGALDAEIVFGLQNMFLMVPLGEIAPPLLPTG